MEIFLQRRIADFSSAELFQIAAEVEAYPKFIPLCIAARILERNDKEWLVDNVFGLGPVRTRFKTHARFDPPAGIVITSNDAVFREMTIQWSFEDHPDGGCTVTYTMKQVFASALTERLVASMKDKIEKDLIENFEHRARKIFKRPH